MKHRLFALTFWFRIRGYGFSVTNAQLFTIKSSFFGRVFRMFRVNCKWLKP